MPLPEFLSEFLGRICVSSNLPGQSLQTPSVCRPEGGGLVGVEGGVTQTHRFLSHVAELIV